MRDDNQGDATTIKDGDHFCTGKFLFGIKIHRSHLMKLSGLSLSFGLSLGLRSQVDFRSTARFSRVSMPNSLPPNELRAAMEQCIRDLRNTELAKHAPRRADERLADLFDKRIDVGIQSSLPVKVMEVIGQLQIVPKLVHMPLQGDVFNEKTITEVLRETMRAQAQMQEQIVKIKETQTQIVNALQEMLQPYQIANEDDTLLVTPDGKIFTQVDEGSRRAKNCSLD